MARPRLPESDQHIHRLVAYLNEEQRALLESFADHHGIDSLSVAARMLIMQGITTMKFGPDSALFNDPLAGTNNDENKNDRRTGKDRRAA